MTREEAIEVLTNHTQYKCNGDDLVAIDMAIKALEQEPCEDAISRQAVMDCFKKWQPYMATRLWDFEQELSVLPLVTLQPCEDAISRQYLLDNCVVDKVTMPYVPVSKIESAPPVTPQQRTGRWIQKEEEGDAEPFIIWECSECHGYQRKQTAFCPNCGAKMEVEENG